MKPETIYLDPSALSYIESLQRRGYPAVKANNDITYGIGVVTTAIAEGLTLDPACANLLTELESYVYPENKIENDKPTKANDHAADALRYGLVGLEANSVTGELMW